MTIFLNLYKGLCASLLIIGALSIVVSASANDANINDDDQNNLHVETTSIAVPNLVIETEHDSSNVYDAKTIYVDTRWGARTNKAATKLTKSHQEYAKQGYRVRDLDLYVENGDLKGFFVTYDRESPPPE